MADETKDELTNDGAETPVEEPAAQEPAADEPAAEESVEEAPSEEPVAEEPVAEEPEAGETRADEPEAEEAAEAEPPAAEEPPAPPAKKKRKRLPRPLRRQRTKPARVAAEGRKPLVRQPKPERERRRRQERRGVVVSSGMDKTIVVRVDTVKAHPRYKKIIRRSSKFHAHDEQNQAKVGDVVRIVEARPLSKTKRWRLVEVVEAAK
jgi:small subunit ribosomal protein S17